MMARVRVLAILALVGLTAAGCVTNRSLGGSIDDSTADLSLRRQLFADRSHNYSDIDIVIFEGRLMLTGTVKTPQARQALADRARGLNNVNEVLNEVIVGKKTNPAQGTRDLLIDERLGAALVADNGIYSGNYQIAVSQGTVFLLGVAQGPKELERVTSHAQTIDGVSNIVSHVIFVGDPRRLQ